MTRVRWIDQLDELDNLDPAWVANGQALVWRRRPGDDDLVAAEAEDLADAASLAKPRLAAARLRRRRALRTFAARALQAHAGGLALQRFDNGETMVLAPIRLHTSLAERDEWMALGLCASKIGVDVEAAEPEPPLPIDLLPQAERLRLENLSDDQRPAAFAQTWTSIEAAAKALDQPFADVLADGRHAPAAFSRLDRYIFAVRLR